MASPGKVAESSQGASAAADAQQYVGALDQGTTSTRFILFDASCRPVAAHYREHTQIKPRAGWLEHNPLEIAAHARECIDGAMETAARDHGVRPDQVRAVGITNQRETTVVWDRHTGLPLHNAVVWQDTRTRDTIRDILQENKISEATVRELTGLPISSYFSGLKLRWLCDNVPKVKEAVANGSALFGTMDTWLLWCLAEGNLHVTDVTNAGRTMLMNIRTLEWDKQVLDALGIPSSVLPTIRSSSEKYGILKDTVLKGTPIAGLVGDQQAALIGQAGFARGHGKNTYGTGCFLIVNTGEEPKFSSHGLLTTPAYKLGPHVPCVYALEGSIGSGGAAVSWLKDNLKLFDNSSDIEELARSVTDTDGVYMVPAFSGLLAPRWREDARGCIVGLTLSSTRAHIARATLASLAFQVCDVLRAAELDMGEPLAELRVDGGATVNNLLLEMQADALGSDVVRPEVVETTALGAAVAAGLAVGFFKSVQEVEDTWREERRFSPKISDAQRQEEASRWEAAVVRSLNWVDGE
jgi:glycerol kinase